ncbi:MAG: chemotaxis protein CheW, partial [Thermodesulfobacteriota bacterium]|nr:chemotaxis protein CheW [Thermodesulfobacteriota bacterium]
DSCTKPQFDESVTQLGSENEKSEPQESQETGSESQITTGKDAQEMFDAVTETVDMMDKEPKLEEVIEEKKIPIPEVQTDGMPDMRSSSSAAQTSIRVNVSLLDSLMTLAGELVLSRNQLLQTIGSEEKHALELVGQRIDLVTSELQEAIMFTRMQPIGNVFNKFPRVVRDMAKNLGKEVELSIEGREVELDKTIIEAISDPLTHLVRNSVDHGIEKPDKRILAGKNQGGHVSLRAYHEAGQVNIEISDDGKGLDGDKLTETAMKKGLITEEQAGNMSKKEKISLIFAPGFSTAEKVTDVSGRGVGMDVVKTNLDRLGGVIDIDSEVGKGTTFRIKLPLTLAIIPSQIISNQGERYAIPQVNIDELLRIPASQVKDRIERVGDAEVVRLREQLLPLLNLADIVGMERTYIDPEDGMKKEDRRVNIADRRSKSISIPPVSGESAGAVDFQFTNDDSQSVIHDDRRDIPDRRYHASSAVNIVVASTGVFKYGLVVDELHDSEEIVVKPLGRHLKHCKGYAGATIMGDGRVALILDVAGIAKMAELSSMERVHKVSESITQAEEMRISQEDTHSLLVFMNGEEQFAVPLDLVARIEKIKSANIERVSGKKVIQYRGGSLPLFTIDEVANVNPLDEREHLQIIVFRVAGREVGLLTTGPVDAMEISIEIDDVTLKQTGIIGSAIIGEYTTLIVDIFEMIEALNPDWFVERDVVKAKNGGAATILLAEDSTFFRNQVKSFMEDDGYKVIEAEDGLVAWNLLNKHCDEISLVVTDIEMPNLDGLELTEKIRQDESFTNIPIIALTSLAGEEDIARGQNVGIDDYQIKLDKEELMTSIYKNLQER